jgi:flagellar hook-basal body complex protein FliE
MRIQEFAHLNPTHRIQRSIERAVEKKQVPSFKDTMSRFLDDVNAAQKEAGDSKKAFFAGEVTDVHQVMTKSEEAKVAFNMLMEIRNKVIDGYNEIMRLRL